MNSEYKAVLQSVEDELPFQITWYDALESLLSIDSVLVSCEEQLDKVDLGVNYESQEAKLDKALTDRGYIEKYLENVQDYVLTNLDEKLYKWFNNGPTEAISTISLDDYSTEDQKSEIYCNYIKFTDFMGASGDGAFIEANKKAYVSEFEDIFANQYQSYKELGCLSDEVELDEYIDAIVMQGSFNHQMDKPVESFVSGVLDVTIIKPLIESVIGVDLITHDDLNGLERGMKGVSALLSIYATGTVLLGTNVSKIGTQEVLAYTAKTMVVDSSAQLTALGVQKIGERCDLPVAITIILSFISGIVVSTKVDGIKIQGKNVSKKIDPPSGNVDKIKDAGIITEGSVGSIETSYGKSSGSLAYQSGSNSYSGEEWCRYFRETYGNNNVTWENATPSQLARSWQGSGKYIGIDEYTDVTVDKGTILYRGEPNGTEYFTTLDAIEQSGRNATTIFEGLQVEKNPIHGYRGEMQGYLFNEDVASAYGITNANPQFGNGGLPQYYVPDVQDLISKGILTPVDNIKLYK